MTTKLTDVEKQFQRFPASLSVEFRRALEKLQPWLGDTHLLNWASQGLDIASQSARSWEAGSEYFRVSPEIAKNLSPLQLMDWARCGTRLCQDSPSIAIAFFRASPESIKYLRPRFIQAWANLGRSLYKGTWKSSALAARFFEVSCILLECMNYQELEKFAGLVDTLSQKSSDLATECLLLGQQVFPKIDGNCIAFLDFCQAVTKTNWREVKVCFESILGVLRQVGKGHHGRFLAIASHLTRSGMSNISLFLSDSARSLARADDVNQGSLLTMAEKLLPVSHGAVAAFLYSGPGLLGRISQHQLTAWVETGIEILKENPDGGLAYFKIESNTSEEVLENLSSAVELDRVKDILGNYCRALAGASVDIASTIDLKAKNIGWVSEEQAATEGTTVYLPPVAHQYESKSGNFSLYKVVSTHQVAHIEYGSFDFSFEGLATQFRDLRLTKEKDISEHRIETIATLIAKSDDQNVMTEEPFSGENLSGAERGFLTDMGRFFSLFNNRKLALDIFTAVEDWRLDYRVRVEYPGVRYAYMRVQKDALARRPEIEQMPVQEAMIEFLVRLSLQQNTGIPFPNMFAEQAKAIVQIARRLLSTRSTVEDSAEATIRVYDIIAELPNVHVPEEDWSEMDFDQEETLSDNELEQLMDQLRGSPGTQGTPSDEEQPYDSPPQVDFRGEFKPEISQLLAKLRTQKTQEGSESQDGMEPDEEMLAQTLADSPELELDNESGQNSQALSTLANDMLKEAGTPPPAVPGQGYGAIPHEEEEGGALEAKEPQTYVYDEWDFRAQDYKPRWCIVREKTLAEGESQFFTDTQRNYSRLMGQIRRQFEMLKPELFRKVKHLPDGEDYDLDSVIESIIDKWAGESPSEKVHWRRSKVERDSAVVFLLDMSASTAEAIDDSRSIADDWDAPDDPTEYMVWLRNRRGEGGRRSYKRIIDLEKESIVLLINALETIGDVYGIYGFSGYGRENVEFYTIKDVDETFSEKIKRRVDKITPLHATRMGPAIRHAITKLERQDTRTKLLFLISDGRPQDRGYSREGVEKEYAIHDTKMALTEARRKNITPFCLTVDKAGHDYLKTMCQDMGYEVLSDINALPTRLPMLYRKLTV
ncbi:hypothetical protein M1N24_03035 [Dehalococcoidia bacterium]|nr:hypothetical protein [Dehalococcoidia bacterium]